MTTPHDCLFQHVFSHPERAAAELRHVLPSDLSATIDWTTLRRLSESFVEADLSRSFADLLFEAQLEGAPVHLMLLLEHKSRCERLTAFQVLRYKCRALERWLEEHPNAPALPAIYAVVVYHGEPAWTAPRDVVDLFGVPDLHRERHGRRLVQMSYDLDDLSRTPDSELRSRATDAVARLALICLQRSRRTDDLLANLVDVAALFREVLDAPDGRDAMIAVFSYISAVQPTPVDEIRRFLRVNVDVKSERVFESVFDEARRKALLEGIERGVEQGIERGFEQGIEQGLAAGRLQASRETLSRQLRKRFGDSFDPSWQHRVAEGTETEIATWLDRVLDARQLDEIFAP